MPHRDGGDGEADYRVEPPAAGPTGGDHEAKQDRAGLGGTQIILSFLTSRGGRAQSGSTRTPDGIVVDHQRRHIYWTNMGTRDPGSAEGADGDFFSRNGSIERVDFDCGNRRTIVPRGAFTTSKQLTADFTEGKLYWCDREGMQVLRCNLDASGLETLVVTGSGDDARDARNWCVGIAVDPVQRMIYWTQKGVPKSGQGRIFRAPIDIPPGCTAADRDDIETLWGGLPEPIDLHLTPDGTLIWTDRDPMATPSTELA